MGTLIRDMQGTDNKEDQKLQRWLTHLADNWKDPAINAEFHALAREISRQIMKEYSFYDITPYIFVQTNLPRDTHKIVFRDLKGYTATTVSAGGRRQQFRLDKTRSVIWIPDEYDNATVEVYEEDLREGNYGSVADIRAGIRDALLHKKLATVMEELHRICNSTEDLAGTVTDGTAVSTTGAVGNQNYLYNPGSNLNKAAIDFAIRKVIGRTGRVVSIVGHPDYLLQIADLPGFIANREAIDDQRNQLQRRGWIGYYRGANVVLVSEYYDEKYNKQVWDPYNIYIVGDGMAEIATLYGIEAVSDYDAMRSVRMIGADQKYVVLSQDPQLKRGFRIQMQ